VERQKKKLALAPGLDNAPDDEPLGGLSDEVYEADGAGDVGEPYEHGQGDYEQ
jgi:hypothetical protein